MPSFPHIEQICAQCGYQTQASHSCPQCTKHPYLKERYALCSILGQGAEGVTYLGFDTQMEHFVVLKERMWKPLAQDTRQKRLEREAKVLRELDHPQIPHFFEHFVLQEGRRKSLYIVQEYIEGPTLRELLHNKRFLQREIWDLAEKILNVLVYLQELSPPIIHRDIKPSNIIFRTHDQLPVLIDFGSVRDALSDRDLGASTYAGTFGYMPPEQIFGHSDCRTDLYSLGALLLELLTRKSPSTLLSPQKSPWKSQVSIPLPFQDFLHSLCHHEAERRFPHAQRARSVLRSLTHPSPAHNKPSTKELITEIKEALRAELANHLSLAPSHNPKPRVREAQSTPLLSTTLPTFEETTLDPLLPKYPSPMNNRRGWWKAKPPRPLHERPPPLHPATQIFFMSVAMLVSAIVLQLLFV